MCSPDAAVQYDHNEFHRCPCGFPSLDDPMLCYVGIALLVAILLFYFCKKKRR